MKVDIFNTTNKYQIIYADPPWEYKQSGSKKNSRGMAKQHNIHQIIMDKIEKHSKKPDITREKITELLGELPRI